MKKVLIITYYWPPMGSSGVQRWAKLSKYFKDYSWEPIIYTAQNPDYPVNDETLCTDIHKDLVVLKTTISEPSVFYKKLTRKKDVRNFNEGFNINYKHKNKTAEAVISFIRGNFFIPDARKNWIKPSLNFLSNYLNNNPIDAIISNGPPHSMHLIALGLKERFKYPWIADFRDPWTEIDYYNQLKLTSWAHEKHKRLEHKVLSEATKVVTISKELASNFNKLGAKDAVVITNGFDEEDFKQETTTHMLNGFLLHHIGVLNKHRNPVVLWKVLADLCLNNNEFKNDLKIKLTGNVDINVFESLKQHNLMTHVDHTIYVNHDKAIELMRQSPVLLLLLNNFSNSDGVIPGKLFEYLAAKRPILAIGKIGANAFEILTETGGGEMFDFTDYSAIKKGVEKLYQQFKANNLIAETSSLEKYSRKNGAKLYTDLLNKVCGV